MAVTQRQSQPNNRVFIPRKLLIISSCIVAGGVHKERGEEYTPTTEEETYNLIRAQRAIEADDDDVDQVKKELADEAKAREAKAAAAATTTPVKK